MAAKKCAECGAELRLRSAPCPLCGSDPTAEPAQPDWSARKEADSPREIDSYQSDLRKLREELKRLREAEAS